MLRIQQKNYYYYQLLISKNAEKVTTTSSNTAGCVKISQNPLVTLSMPSSSVSTQIIKNQAKLPLDNLAENITKNSIPIINNDLSLNTLRSEHQLPSTSTPINHIQGSPINLNNSLPEKTEFSNNGSTQIAKVQLNSYDSVPSINNQLMKNDLSKDGKNLKRRVIKETRSEIEVKDNESNMTIDFETKTYETLSDTDNRDEEDDIDDNNDFNNEENDEENLMEFDKDGLVKKRKINKKRTEWSHAEVISSNLKF